MVRTHAVEGAWSDPMLWLYNENNLVTANDDWFGLQSHISIELQPGLYRLRAGVCCGDPDRWYDNVRYTLDTNSAPVVSTTVETWLNTTTTSNETPSSEPQVSTLPPTSSLPTSSSTTTTQPDPTTTTSTLIPTSTSTVPSTTTTDEGFSSTESSSTSSPTSTSPPMLTTSTTITTTTSFTTTTSTTTIPPPPSSVSSPPSSSPPTIPSEASVSVPEPPTDTEPGFSTPQVSEPVQTYTQKVGVGPFKVTLTVTEAQRTTVVAAAIIQITAVASMTASGVSTGGSTGGSTTRRKR
jgi:hypothetical protein